MGSSERDCVQSRGISNNKSKAPRVGYRALEVGCSDHFVEAIF